MSSKTQKSGWKTWRFDQIAINVNERIDDPSKAGVEHYVGLEHLDPDSLRIRRWGTPDDVEATKLCFKKGDIIFGRRRAYQRKLGVAEFDGICSAHAMVLRPRTDVVLPEFLPFFMQSDLFMNRAVEISVGSLSPTINWKTLAVQQFVLPPLEEQRRTIELLMTARLVTENQAEALGSLEMMRKATINHLFTPNNSETVRLEQVATMQNGRPFPGDEYGNDGIKLLRPGNLGISGYFHWSDEKTVFLDPSWQNAASDFVVNGGDVVINLTAQSLEDGFMGRVCLAKDGDTSLLNQRIGRFRCDESKLLPEYLFRSLQTSQFRQHAHSNCEGSKVKHLFWQHLAKYEIALPSLAEQRDVIQKCAEVDAAISSLSCRLQRSKDMQSQMVNAYAGGAQ